MFRKLTNTLCLTILIIVFGASAFAETPMKASECNNTKQNKTALKQISAHDRSQQLNCCCPSVIKVNQDSNPATENFSNEERWEKRASREVEQVSTLAKITLNDVKEHTDFLAALWKWTTIIWGIIIGGLAIFGIKSISDIYRFKRSVHADIEKDRKDIGDLREKDLEHLREIREEQKQFSKDAHSNHVVMLYVTRVEAWIDTAMELEEKAKNSGITAEEKINFEARALDKFKSMRKVLEEVRKKEDVKDAAIAGYAYNLYGYALYKLGDIPNALLAAKRSIEFKSNSTSLYNAACYAARLELAALSVDYLKRAIELEPTFLTDARTEQDFDKIRHFPEFQVITNFN